jgi:circadian clock protein KaiB
VSDKTRKTGRPKAAPSPSGSRRAASVSGSEREQIERQLGNALDQRAQRYVLRLYVTGTTPASSRAIERVRSICEEHLHGRYELDVIDIYQKPALAKDEQIIATPTLIKVLPAPLRRFIGDLSRAEKILFGMDLREKS